MHIHKFGEAEFQNSIKLQLFDNQIVLNLLLCRGCSNTLIIFSRPY